MSDVIAHRLDLALALIDTTTGRSVTAGGVILTPEEGLKLDFLDRGNGLYVLIGYNRENFHMSVEVRGYEKCDIYVDYGELDERRPIKEVFLIPSESPEDKTGILTLSGRLPGLSELSLIESNKVLARTDAFNERKLLLRVFEKGNRLKQENSPYAVVGADGSSFCRIDVKESTDENTVLLKAAPDAEISRNAPVMRMIFGYVREDGEYRIAIRSSGETNVCMLRYVFDGEEKFIVADFNETDEIELL